MPPLNGDAKAIYEKIEAVEKVNTERHNENKKSTEKIFDKLDDLPCKGHIEKFNQYDKHLAQGLMWRIAIFGCLATLLIFIVNTVYQSGRISESYSGCAEASDKMMQHIEKDEQRWDLYRIEDAYKLREM